MNMQNSLTEQYRCELTLDESRATLTGAVEENMHAMIRSILPGATFKPSNNNPETSLIYCPSIDNGTRPCGWVTRMNVPTGFDVHSINQERRDLLNKAA